MKIIPEIEYLNSKPVKKYSIRYNGKLKNIPILAIEREI